MMIQRRRMILLFAALTAWTIIVIVRLGQIQLSRHDEYVRRAGRQQERTFALAPVRGSIFDAQGRLLAESVVSHSLYADPQSIEEVSTVVERIGSIEGLGVREDVLRKRLGRGGEFAWLARQVDDELYEKVMNLGLPGIYSVEEHRRRYPNERLLSSVLGIVGIDGEGLAGVEHSLDKFVRGRPGVVTLLRDARRGMYMVSSDTGDGPVDGHNLVLTIDEVIQYITEHALEQAVEGSGAKSGTAIVVNPHNGAILAMASFPDFDPNAYGSYPQSAWRNRVVQDVYEPGSTFKIVTAAAAIEEGVVTPSELIDCGDGSIVLGPKTVREHGGHAYGVISFEDVLVESSNVGTIRVGLRLGPERLYDYSRRFGFGERTGLELPGESVGILRAVDQWSGMSTGVISIGQEIAATPLQVVMATAVIANGGMRVSPRIVDRVVDEDGQTVFQPPPTQPIRVVSEKTAAVMNEMLKAVVFRGTGGKASLPEYVVAGKTGTAQKAGPGGYLPNETIASFTGYVPADRPRLAILVAIDEPRTSQYGGEIAAPVFREIAERSLRYMRVEPAFPRRVIMPPQVVLRNISAADGEVLTAERRPEKGEVLQ
ncbi:MAG: penicillin-binding protein 2 [Acidobacteria bacterium]|nr:penicillin-binding protein 2 [Acidobacteriota bacterium]